jgi:PAS domain S-box-containing protein
MHDFIQPEPEFQPACGQIPIVERKILPTDREIVLHENDFIVSKTDKLGKITYCNSIFIKISGYSEAELLGKNHNILRHPDMPSSLYYLLWNTINSGEEFFGYIKNLCKDGSFYWVFANISPRYDPNTGEKIGYFSVRRKPDANKLNYIENIYCQMSAAERQGQTPESISAGIEVLNHNIDKSQRSYREFILTL